MKKILLATLLATAAMSGCSFIKLSAPVKKVKIAVIDWGILEEDKGGAVIRSFSGIYKGVMIPDFSTDNFHGSYVSRIAASFKIDGTAPSFGQYAPEIAFYGINDVASESQSYGRNGANAIKAAVKWGAQIINMSYQGEAFDMEEYLAIKEASAKGVIFVVAAGNLNQHLGIEAMSFPCNLNIEIENVICVGATSGGKKAYYSNYGAGVDVYTAGSTENEFQRGTSFAAPRIARAIAFALQNSEMSGNEVLKVLRGSVNNIELDLGVSIAQFNDAAFFEKVRNSDASPLIEDGRVSFASR